MRIGRSFRVTACARPAAQRQIFAYTTASDPSRAPTTRVTSSWRLFSDRYLFFKKLYHAIDRRALPSEGSRPGNDAGRGGRHDHGTTTRQHRPDALLSRPAPRLGLL